mgnify:CR=1 FL=1
MNMVPRATTDLRNAILSHLTYTVGKDPKHAMVQDWRLALSFAVRDRMVDSWFASTRKAYETGAKRVYYLSMEFLIGRLLEDALVNLQLDSEAKHAVSELGLDYDAILKDDPTGRVACETLVTTGMAMVAGEVTTEAWVDIESLVRSTVLEIGYDHSDLGFDGAQIGKINVNEFLTKIRKALLVNRNVKEAIKVCEQYINSCVDSRAQNDFDETPIALVVVIND